MKKIISYIAISLNGKIAKPDGSVYWLESIPNPEKLDYGYAKFSKSIDTTIQGGNTYRQLLDWGIGFPYKTDKNFVFTRNPGLDKIGNVEFITTDHVSFVKDLKNGQGKNIWVVGGGQINTLLFNEGLIDELIVFVMPIVLSEGIDLFEGLPKERQLNLIRSECYSTSVIELHYKVD